MKNKLRHLFFMLWIATNLLIGTQPAMAFNYDLTCEQGRLAAFDSAADADGAECAQFKKLGFEKCFDTRKKDNSPDSIALSVPFDGYYTSREHATYSRAKMQQIIDFAIKNEIDPYLALAFRIMEYPPTQEKAKFDAYETRWGVIPLDAPAFADYLGCRVSGVIDKPGSGGKFSVFSESSLKSTIVIDEKASEEKICMENTGMGGSPRLTIGCTAELKCCVNAKVKLVTEYNTCKSIDKDDRTLLLEKASASYLKQRINSALRKYQTLLNDPISILAFTTQSFNGYGKYGITEKMSNNCLNRMNFSETPLYGAGVGDLMLNSLMANNGVRDMVTTSLKKFSKKNAKSLFCDALGSNGNHSLEAGAFAAFQQQFMADRKNCPAKTYQLKVK